MEDEVCRAGGLNDMYLFGEMNHWCGRLDGERIVSCDVGRGGDVLLHMSPNVGLVPEASAL